MMATLTNSILGTSQYYRPIRAIIVEDSPNVRDLVRLYLGRYFSNRIEIVGEAADVGDSIVLIRRMKPQLLLLDIELLTGTCFDILDILGEEERKKYSVIFITQFDSYVRQALQYGVVDYIDKPIIAETFVRGIERGIRAVLDREVKQQTSIQRTNDLTKKDSVDATKSNQDNSPMIAVHYHGAGGGKKLNILIAQITHCQALGSYTEIFQRYGKPVVDSRPLKRYEEMLLQHDFVRVSRSLLVNPKYCNVQRENKRSVSITLPDGTHYTVERSYKERILAYLSGK